MGWGGRVKGGEGNIGEMNSEGLIFSCLSIQGGVQTHGKQGEAYGTDANLGIVTVLNYLSEFSLIWLECNSLPFLFLICFSLILYLYFFGAALVLVQELVSCKVDALSDKYPHEWNSSSLAKRWHLAILKNLFAVDRRGVTGGYSRVSIMAQLHWISSPLQ